MRTALAAANLALRFVLELAGLAAVALWGFRVASGPWRWLLAAAAALVFAVGWGRFLAPKAMSGLTQPQKDAVGTVVLLVAAALLAWSGRIVPAGWLAAAVVVNAALLFILRPAAARLTGSSSSRS